MTINALESFYKMDIVKIAKLVDIPVRAINSDATPKNIDNNKKYFKNYNYAAITGTGHYPMLERPEEFNVILTDVIEELNSINIDSK